MDLHWNVAVVLSLSLVLDVAAVAGTRSLPCPVAEDILPCLCSVDVDGSKDMDCTFVEGEEQLARVFSAVFPFPDFRRLKIEGNSRLKVLQEGALGVVSFREIYITFGVLEEVQPRALNNSLATLAAIHMQSNHLSQFPFEDLPSFWVLDHLDLGNNLFSTFPSLQSTTLSFLSLAHNQIGDVPADAFRTVPAIEQIYLSGNRLTQILTGTFAGYAKLSMVHLGDNLLTRLSSGAVQLTSLQYNKVYLQDNFLVALEANAIAGVVGGFLSLHNNTIKELKEAALRPLLEEEVVIDVSANPLTCGCEIAWLVTNEDLLSQVDGDATCYDGEYIVDLDPGIYIDICDWPVL